MPDIPSSIALTVIADGAEETASPLRNNFAAIQGAVNGNIAALTGGSAGQRLVAVDADTVAWGGRVTVSGWSGGPPASPQDGDRWIAVGPMAGAEPTDGTRWEFQYNASSSSAYKWEFVGGAPYCLFYNGAGVTWNDARFVALGSGWYTYPGVTTWSAARAGDYLVAGTFGFTGAASSTTSMFLGTTVNGGAGVNFGTQRVDIPATYYASISYQWKIAAVGVNQYIGSAWAPSVASTQTIQATVTSILPVRIA